MKDEYKIIIGAIIVIIIVLAGVFALSGSNNAQPTATPAVTPVTATPTPTPTPVGPASPTPTPAVSSTLTPTPMPESGVMLTEWGYWITYPPLGPQNWSKPNPKPEWNVVFFNRTSDKVSVPNNMDTSFLKQVSVVRAGDLSGTANVTINSSHSENAWEGVVVSDYRYGIYGDNLTYLGDNSHVLTFGPGVSEQIINIDLDWEVDEGSSDGFVKLTIEDVDGGYSIGHNPEYTLTMADVPTVRFIYGSGFIWVNETVGDLRYTEERFYDVDDSGDMVNVTFYIASSYVPGTLTVNFYGDPAHNMTGGDYILYPYTFTDPGTLWGIVKVEINKGIIYDGYMHTLDVYIADSEDYAKDEYDCFHIYIG